MESDDHLDLETAIARWRASTTLDAGTLDELETHLRDTFAELRGRGLATNEAFAHALNQLGDSTLLAAEFSKLAKPSRFTTMLTSLFHSPRLRRYARRLALAIAIALPLRLFVLAPYRAAGASVTPEIPAGSHVLAWRLAPKFAPGDIAIYREGDYTYLGRITAVSGTDLTVVRNNQPDHAVARAAVIGRVILTTR